MQTSPCSLHAIILRSHLLKPGALAVATLCIAMTAAKAAPVSLGEAANFGVLAYDTVTNTGPTVIHGNLGLTPGTSVTGFSPSEGTVTGDILIGANAFQAQLDAAAAFATMGILPADVDLTGEVLGGSTAFLTAGVYRFDTSAQLTGDLTLSGPGEFIFLIGSTLTTDSLSSILLINGANASDIYFDVGSSATLGTGSFFAGTILASEDITATTGATINGRLLSLNGAVTLDTNTITAVPEPASAVLLLPAMAILFAHRGRRKSAC